MRRLLTASLASVVFLGLLVGSPTAIAGHNQDFHSPNLVQIAEVPHSGARGFPISSDLAFWDKLLFAGDFGGFRILHIAEPSRPVVLADVSCNGAQGDVGVWENLLFVSVDRPQTKATCDSVNTNPMATQAGFEGIRIFDVGNPRRPMFIKGVPTNCGSHTHTVVPDLANDRVLIYISHSLPSAAPSCVASPTVSIIDVPLNRPQDAQVIGTVNVAPAESCHDIGVHLPKMIAAAACISEGQLWDISNPASPVVKKHIVNPDIQIWHSGGFTWDGAVAIFGDEFAGAAVDGGCVNPEDNIGRIWFYDRVAVENAMGSTVSSVAPFLVGSFKIPRPQAASELCTAHNYNVIPLKTRYIMVSAFYEGGTSVVEFTNPSDPREIAFYDPRRPQVPGDLRGAWSSYWYNGIVYVNDLDQDMEGGVEVLRFLDPDVKKAVVLHHLNPQTQEVIP